MAFLYRVQKIGESKDDVFFVKIAKHIDYVTARVDWQDDPQLPQWKDDIGGTLMPDIDISQSCHKFLSEQEAVRFMALHYASELKQESLSVVEENIDVVARIREDITMCWSDVNDGPTGMADDT